MLVSALFLILFLTLGRSLHFITRTIFVGPSGPTSKLIKRTYFLVIIVGNMNKSSMLIEGFSKTLESATDCDGIWSSFRKHTEIVVETQCLHENLKRQTMRNTGKVLACLFEMLTTVNTQKQKLWMALLVIGNIVVTCGADNCKHDHDKYCKFV